MADQLPVTFGQLLRQLRRDAGLTMEALADRAGVAVRTISDLERGLARSPRESTVSGLVWGLKLQASAKAGFEAVARGRTLSDGLPVTSLTAPPRTLPRDVGSFTGRVPQLAQLVEGAANTNGLASIYAITGMAGIGKTALAVHAAHQLAARFPDGQIFLPLNAHTPGQRPMDPAAALMDLLQTAGIDARQIPDDRHARAMLWRHWLADRRALLLLDDAVDSEQVRPLLPGAAGSLTIVTSRRNLTGLEDARAVRLDVLAPDEAAELLVRLAARPGPDRDDPAIGNITGLCGNLPLAIGMLGRRLHYNPAWTPADLAAELAHARDRLEQMRSENVSVAAAFDLSYQDLDEDQQRMFRRLGLHPGTDTDAWAAAALDDISPRTARRNLQALYDHNMIAEPTRGRYEFHDLIREHARALAAADPLADRADAVGRLLDFYLHTATIASPQLARRTLTRPAASGGCQPAHSPDVSTRKHAATWMDVERLNLHAAAACAGAQDRLSHAVAIPAVMHGFLRSQGHWDQALTLHQAAVDAAGHDGDRLGEIGALTDLGDVQYLTGNFAAAAASLTRALDLSRDLGDCLGEANALIEFGVLQQATGDYPGAAASLTRALDLSRSQGDQLGEASALNNLGIVQFVTGDYAAAATDQEQALAIYQSLGDQLGEASALNSLGGILHATGDYQSAIANLTQALDLYRSAGDRIGTAYAIGNLGAAQCVVGDYPAAASSLNKALGLYRDLGSRNGEADILNNLGTLYRTVGDYPPAVANLTQALELYQILGDQVGEAIALSELGVIQHATRNYPAATANLTRAVRLAHDVGERSDEAEALNNLGDLYLDAATPADAHAIYRQALAIAADIGSPLEEARAMEGIGRSLLVSGQPTAGTAMLQRSLALYEQIQSPNSERVAAMLR